MKRGYIRIVSGIILLLLQVASILGTEMDDLFSPNALTYNVLAYNVLYYIGFFLPAIIGISLLLSGIVSCLKGHYSKLILFSNTRKFHTVIKWIGFAVSIVLFANYLYIYIENLWDTEIFYPLSICSTLAFSIYLLLCIYRKPSCLFSTTLIFLGISYIYLIIENLTYSMAYLYERDNLLSYIFAIILPRFLMGILYIVTAIILHTEHFSTKVIRSLGWILFILELFSKILSQIIVWQRFYFDFPDLFCLLYVSVIFFYLSRSNINTLRDVSNGKPQILFCRKCGEKLMEGSNFCPKCGTEIIKEVT